MKDILKVIIFYAFAFGLILGMDAMMKYDAEHYEEYRADRDRWQEEKCSKLPEGHKPRYCDKFDLG